MVGTATLRFPKRSQRALLALLTAFAFRALWAQPFVAEGACRDGEANGAFTLRTTEGRLLVSGAFARGQGTGTFVFWSDRGARVAVVPYENGRKTGTVAVWYRPPSVSAEAPRKSEAAYVDGRMHGEKRSWYQNGEHRTWLRYENGELVEARAWSAAGSSLSEAAARAQATRDADADETFYATLEKLVASHAPKCDVVSPQEQERTK